jgi:transglutaminase-like putative cysteine protease
MFLLAAVGFLFYPSEFLALMWLIDLAKTLSQDMVYILQGELIQLSAQFRTILFLIGWVLLITVAHGMMLQRYQGLWFIGMTLLYLIALQIAIGLDTTQGIIRTLGCGAMMLALLNISKIEEAFEVRSKHSGWPGGWFAAALVLAAVTIGIGWVGSQSPEAKPIRSIDWLTLSERWQSMAGSKPVSGTAAAVARSGYSSDDSKLGGPLVSDPSIVFTAYTPELTYWRGESKDFYDGKGWSSSETQLTNFVPDTSISVSAPFTQEVMWSEANSNKQLFAGGSLASVDSLITMEEKALSPELVLIDREHGKITVPEIADSLSYYKITTYANQPSAEALSMEASTVPSDIAEMYLQLPVKFPSAVRGLAKQITAGLTSSYDKVSAIEQYLRTNFPYSLDEPTYPGSKDFVEHFLFVDQTGYCEHFSTAMVVMLRSIGIPARWVKGFVSGEPGVSSNGEYKHVTVRAKDAHAWVEVYFPQAEWVTFDPTPGFTNSAPLSQAGITAGSMKLAIPAAARIEDSDGNGRADHFKEGIAKAEAYIKGALQTLQTFASNHTGLLVFIASGSIALLITLIGWRRRKALLPKEHISILGGRRGSFHPSYRQINQQLYKLYRIFGPKPPNQTVREYVGALQAANEAQREALLEFTRIYEAIHYDQSKQHVYSKREIAAVWKAIQASGTKQLHS